MLDLERRRLARAAQKEKFEQLRINAFDDILQARPCVELREMRQHRESGPEIRSRECPICDKHSCRTQRANEDRKPVSTAVRPTARRRTEMKPDRSFKAKERRRQEKQRAWLSKRLGSNLAVLEQTQLECSTANVVLLPATAASSTLAAKGPIELENERCIWMGSRSACNMKALLRESIKLRGHDSRSAPAVK